MTAGPNGEHIQSTGTAFANIGVITIDNATKKIVGNELKAIWHTEKNADASLSPSLTTKRATKRSPRPPRPSSSPSTRPTARSSP